tara:strand:- start:6764 stop:7369 length:606 start_codon:yes stop_codon:yes gene_type:complete
MEVQPMSSENCVNQSIYIPVIGKEISEKYMKRCFKEKNIGEVDRVDFVLNKNKMRREAFVHFSKWYNTPDANSLMADLSNPETKTHFVYKGTSYWPILPNKNPVERNSYERKSTSVYELEDRINIIEKTMEQLSFVSKVHDANIRYILRKSDKGETSTNVSSVQIKRQKTDDIIYNGLEPFIKRQTGLKSDKVIDHDYCIA